MKLEIRPETIKLRTQKTPLLRPLYPLDTDLVLEIKSLRDDQIPPLAQLIAKAWLMAAIHLTG